MKVPKCHLRAIHNIISIDIDIWKRERANWFCLLDGTSNASFRSPNLSKMHYASYYGLCNGSYFLVLSLSPFLNTQQRDLIDSSTSSPTSLPLTSSLLHNRRAYALPVWITEHALLPELRLLTQAMKRTSVFCHGLFASQRTLYKSTKCVSASSR